jgi:putative pyruvate formate lyase activating enzyme
VRYVGLAQSGELEKRVEEALWLLAGCSICPHACAVDRGKGGRGYCRAGLLAKVSGFGPHFGEEPPLVGRGGSGTIFFSYCSLRCVFCQNYDISQLGYGEELTADELARVMQSLQQQGCENINFVTPTHFVPQILEALLMAARGGLTKPLVYNCGTYECPDTLRLLDGVVDIYLPDTKYTDEETARKYSGISGYPEHMFRALKEMHRQVGDLVTDRRGVAVRGLMIRHLVMPGGLAATEEVLRFIATELSPHTYVNLMDQYRPAFRADRYPEINRRPTRGELAEARGLARQYGLTRAKS